MVRLSYDNDKIIPVGIASFEGKAYLYYCLIRTDGISVCVDATDDGKEFTRLGEAKVVDVNGNTLEPQLLSDFRVSAQNGHYILIYLLKGGAQKGYYIASSSDLLTWQTLGKLPKSLDGAVVVSNTDQPSGYVAVYGKYGLHLAYSADLKVWEQEEAPLLKGDKGFYGRQSMRVIGTNYSGGKHYLIYLSYLGEVRKGNCWLHISQLGAKKDKLVQNIKYPLWEDGGEFNATNTAVVGTAYMHDTLIVYWFSKELGLVATVHDFHWEKGEKLIPKAKYSYSLTKLRSNPILAPNSNHPWESKATFNPAALFEGGKVHIVYRAVGDSDVSVMGYATSRDGIHVNYRHAYPVYVPREPFEGNKYFRHHNKLGGKKRFVYASGGGCWGGCEDPRITKVGDKIYMTYSAYNGWEPPRVALTSIDVDDFLTRKWNWKSPVVLSPPGEIHKNWVIFPEKINGKYAILHSISPTICIEYFDTLDEFDKHKFIKSHYHGKVADQTRWDNWVRGAGPPPIMTKDGWLVLYHAMDVRDPNRYKLGAMMLDASDPTKVLYRSNTPLLEPNETYENVGFKSGVVYSCGALTMDDDLYVYYGGADTVTCVAQSHLDEFLDHLKHKQTANLYPIS